MNFLGLGFILIEEYKFFLKKFGAGRGKAGRGGSGTGRGRVTCL
jgi:hypothetical protein